MNWDTDYAHLPRCVLAIVAQCAILRPCTVVTSVSPTTCSSIYYTCSSIVLCCILIKSPRNYFKVCICNDNQVIPFAGNNDFGLFSLGQKGMEEYRTRQRVGSPESLLSQHPWPLYRNRTGVMCEVKRSFVIPNVD